MGVQILIIFFLPAEANIECDCSGRTRSYLGVLVRQPVADQRLAAPLPGVLPSTDQM